MYRNRAVISLSLKAVSMETNPCTSFSNRFHIVCMNWACCVSWYTVEVPTEFHTSVKHQGK